MIWCNPMSTRADDELLARADKIWERIGTDDLPVDYVYIVDRDDVYATATTPNASYEGDPEAVYAMMLLNYDQNRTGSWAAALPRRTDGDGHGEVLGQ